MGNSSPIKVLHIIARMNVGGPAVEIVELMRGLDPQVVSQRLVTGYCDDDEADYLETQAPDMHATRIEGLGRSIRPADDARALAQLVRIIRSSRPDIVHTHTAKAGTIGRIAAKVSGTSAKVIHTYHGHLLYGYFSPAKTKVWIELEKSLAFFTDSVITVADAVRRDLLSSGIGTESQYRTIRSATRFHPVSDEADARRCLNLDENQVVVSMISRISQVKRPDRFLDVVRLVAGQRSDIHFVLAGGGDLMGVVERTARAEALPITVMGWLNDVERVIAATDVMILTSDNEGIPLSLVEGAACCVPAVATDVGGVAEIVQAGRTGLLCDSDPRALADAIIYLADNPDVRKAMGREARSYVSESFSKAAFLRAHLSVYQGCLDSGLRDRTKWSPKFATRSRSFVSASESP